MQALTMMRSRLLAVAVVAASWIFAAHADDSPPRPQPAEWVDPLFTEPYIDVDEWRDKPVRHRYVHGGFKGTDLLFSMYFPPKELYEGRFFQHAPAMPGNENTAQLTPEQLAKIDITQENTTIGFAIASGAYLVESNQGSRTKYPTEDRTITGYRASAAVAKYSRVLAQEMYGPHRPYGYGYGGSGGGYKTISWLESTRGTWDGVVPYVIGSPMSIPNVFAVQAHAARLLKDKWRMVVDALDPGGSGNMYAGLTDEEAAALREATRFGFPPRAWFIYERLGYGPFGGLIDEIVTRDPTYFDDFWKLPGYLGANPPESLKRAHIQKHKTKITRIVMSDEAKKMGGFRVTSAAVGTNVVPAMLELAQLPAGEMKGATIKFTSGGAAGKVASASGKVGALVPIDIGPFTFPHIHKIRVGDEVEIDNSIYLAAQTYHRHQVPSRDFYVWDQFRGPDGKPLYPQRPRLLGPEMAERAAGSVQSGVFEGKMIVVETLVDEYAYPWQADWYYGKVKEAQGARADEKFRLWFIDNALHGSPQAGPERTRVVAYVTALQQALRDLARWVEKGIPPPANSVYKVVDGQVELPATAAQRRGVQPVVALTANGSERAEVKVGEAVTFKGTIEVPPGTGKVVRAEWDFEGAGDYPIAGKLAAEASGERATVTTRYTFSEPGTYFPALRVASQRTPDGTPYAAIENLARVRVVVSQ